MVRRRDVRWSLVGLASLMTLLWAGVAMAQVPESLTHQGRLLDDSGEPRTGEVSLRFTIYDAETDGALVWESQEKTVDLGDSGFYSVTLGGEENPISGETLGGGAPLWIALSVDGGEELSPRIRLRSVPYAVRAGTAASAESVPWENVGEKPDGVENTIGSLSCESGQIAAWDGSSWICEDAGETYDGGDFAVSDQACGSDEVVSGIDDQGNVQCATDSDTTYSAGAGLEMGGNTTLELASQSCSGGQKAVGIDSNGSLICDPDANTVYNRSCSSGEVVGGLQSDGSVTCVSDDNTTYSAGAGLTESGNTFSLSTQTCSTGNVSTGIQTGTVQCAAPVQGGNGIDVDTSTDPATVSADTTTLQQRVTGSCTGDSYVTGINQDGTVSCSPAPSEPGDCSNKDFDEANVCPAGDIDGPNCDEVPVGSFCEGGDSFGDTCDSLASDLNNCGSFDWFLRTD